MIRLACLLPLILACVGEPRAAIDEPWADAEVPAGTALRFRGDAVGTRDGRLVWDFGDGTSLEGTSPTHSFAEPGERAVRLQVFRGADSVPATEALRSMQVVAAAPPGNYAIRLHGTGRDDIDRVKIRIDDVSDSRPGPPADIGATDFTIEFWLRADSGANQTRAVECGANVAWINGNVLLDRDRYGQDRKFGLSLAGGLPVFGVSGAGSGDLTVCGTTRLDDGKWHHFAVTRERSSGAIALFVDGRREAFAEKGPGGDISYPDNGRPQKACGGPCDRSDPYLVLGAEKHDVSPDYPSFRGEVDELRLSTTIRYRDNFSVPTAPFVPDETTAALYHFDEGAGTLALDSATLPGGPSHGLLRRGGVLNGPLWVSSTVPFSPAQP